MGREADGVIDHEGHVLAELGRTVPIYAEDGWTGTGCADTDDAGPTGRHRAACTCGWRGEIVDTGELDVFLPAQIEDKLLLAWERHVAPLRGLSALSDAADDARRAQELVAELVAGARAGGSSWSHIGSALGLTKQAAQQRYGSAVSTSA